MIDRKSAFLKVYAISRWVHFKAFEAPAMLFNSSWLNKMFLDIQRTIHIGVFYYLLWLIVYTINSPSSLVFKKKKTIALSCSIGFRQAPECNDLLLRSSGQEFTN